MTGRTLRRALVSLLCGGLALTAAPTAAAGTGRQLRLGFNDTLGAPAADAGIVDLHRRLGVTVWRHPASWRQAQPAEGGRFDWDYLDRVDAHMRSIDAGWIALVIATPEWAQGSRPLGPCFLNGDGPGCHRPPDAAHLPDLRRFAAALVERYPRIVAVEVFNEPNVGQTSWQPSADPEHYAAALRAVHDGVRAQHPSVPVLIGGLTVPDVGATGAMAPEDFLAAVYAAGGAASFDGIGLHPYPLDVEPTSPDGWLRTVDAIRAVRRDAGDEATPLWITETGYTTTGPFSVSPATQAEWLPAIVRAAARAPDIASVVVHTLRDRPGGSLDSPETGFGVVDERLSPKPAFETVRAAFAELQAEAARQGRLTAWASALARAQAKQRGRG